MAINYNQETDLRQFYVSSEKLIYDTKNRLSPAFSNQYSVLINFPQTVGRSQKLVDYLKSRSLDGIQNSDIGYYVGLRCSDAALPGSSIETSEVSGLRQGVTSNYAVQRKYQDVELTFYIDQDYFTLDVFNGWMEFISPSYTGNTSDSIGLYKKLRYPEEYKCRVAITAFNREFFSGTDQKLARVGEGRATEPSNITYYLINAFPTNVVSTPLKYGDADLMRVSVLLKYDYYLTERKVRKGSEIQVQPNKSAAAKSK
jgi:hypothetical protein